MAHIVSGETAKSVCPNCSAILDRFTGARLGAFFELPMRVKGEVTVCASCGARLIFADDQGRVRIMTEHERATIRLDPQVELLLEKMMERRKRSQPNFTQRRYD
jgi:hypothetical protein